MTDRRSRLPPILANKHYAAPSAFTPDSLLREARRQKRLAAEPVPPVCVLDPDGDIVRYLQANGLARRHPGWACYHTDLFVFELAGRPHGIVGCAVGAPFAVLVAEQLFACGCRYLISVTSAGQVAPGRVPPYFIVVDRALRDEGTSHHYLPPSDYSEADRDLVRRAGRALADAGLAAEIGATWTTDAPYRETRQAIDAAAGLGILAVEMEAAALYAFATARRNRVLCLAHVSNQMGKADGDFEKGLADGADASLRIISSLSVL